MTSLFNLFASLSDTELRDKVDEIYTDVLDAVQLVPNTPWHEACFAALYIACEEMNKRRMPPPELKGLPQ
jgi:hypothetical protein